MELCNQFLAPNGEPSVLYASLLQKYGPDKALQLWNWAQTLSNVEKTDAGEPTLAAVEKEAKGTKDLNLENAVVVNVDNFNSFAADDFNIAPKAAKKQLDFHFVQIRDVNGTPTGHYFDYQLQKDVENSIIFTYANLYLSFLNNPAAEQQLADSGMTANQFLKSKIQERFQQIHDRFEKDAVATGSEKSKIMLNLYKAVLTAFDHKDNSFWKNAMAKLERRGLVSVDEDGELLDESGQIVRSFDDDSLGIDVKQTMSSQMKMFLFTIPESEIGAVAEPEEMKLIIPDAQIRANIVAGVTKRISLPAATAEANNLTPKDKLNVRLSEPEVKERTERLVNINGKQMLAVATTTGENGNVIVELSTYQKPTQQLTAVKNALEFPQLANTEKLYQELTGLLSERTANFDDYIKAMNENNSPNVRRVAEKLSSPNTPQHIRNQFVSVMTTHYQRMMMVMVKKGKDGFQETYVFDSNRNSEINMLLDAWREFQKRSDIFVKDGLGGRVINRDLARGYYETLTEIYNRQPKDENERRQLQNDKRALLTSILEDNGIELNEKVIDYLMSEKDKKFKTFGGFTKEAAPIGIVDIMVHRMYIASDEELLLGENEALETYKANNPLYTETRIMNKLAQLQLPYVTKTFSQTHKSTEGKTIYSYGLNTALSHAARKIATDPSYRKRYDNSVIARQSWLLEQLNNNAVLREQFGIIYLDGLKNALGERDGVTRVNMSDREQWATALGLFQNGNKDTGHLIGMTHADKSKTPVYTNVPKINNVASFVENGKDIPFSINRQTAELIYKHVFKSEHKRITTLGGENIKQYAEGKKHFYFLPLFNYDKLSQLKNRNLISEAEFNQIYNPNKELNKFSVEPAYLNAVYKVIGFQMNQMVNNTYKSWENSGLLENGLPGSNNYYAGLYGSAGAYMDVAADDYKMDMNSWVLKNGQRVDRKAAVKHMGWLAAAHYTVNSFMMNVNAAQLFHGDPALAWKGSIEKTYVEYNKRLAKDIAPGREGDISKIPTYVSITAADYEPIIAELIGKRNWRANATDAQEITTMKEKLNVMYHMFGEITKDQYERAMSIVNNPDKDGFYQFPADLEQIILQPEKPVAAGLRDADDQGVMRYDYVKSSAYALYPPITKGLEIDKLRVAMERGSVDRVNFISAKKLGAPAQTVKLFDDNGKISPKVFESVEWTTAARQEMKRENYRRQQDNPYEEDKDAILTVSQMNKLITEMIATIPTKFTLNGKEYTGAELRKVKEDLRKQLLQINYNKLMKKAGSKAELYRLLAEEASKRSGYTFNDILALTSKQEDGSLTLPLMFAPSASRLESMMMSLVNNVVKVKMPGKSFIQASPAGFQSMVTWEESNLDKNAIVWTKPVDGELKTAHIDADGNVQPAQVLVGFNYFNNKGERLNIEDFIIEENGKKMLDTTKLPAELFQLIGARIPNQGHSSMLPIEIVGFLPQNMGDMIVVPAAITKQMGADFDVDKLYTYHRAYEYKNNAFTVTNDAESEDSIKNQYFDVHWTVLTNPAMFDRVMAELDKDDLSLEAETYGKVWEKDMYAFGPAYQMTEFQSMKGAKVLVGQTSLASTSNAELQNRNIGIEYKGDSHFNGILVKTEDGKTVDLTSLSGYGVATYNGKTRTKADNIQIQQSESVDHAKNKIIDKINLNPHTSAASLAMSRLQTPDEGTPGEKDFKPGVAIGLNFNAGLLMQPIIRQYVDKMSRANDILSTEFKFDVQMEVVEELREEYEALIGDAETRNQYMVYGAKELKETIFMKEGPEFYQRQLDLLDLFLKFDSVGRQLVSLQSTTSQATRGAGKTLLQAVNTDEKAENLGKINPSEPYYLTGVSKLLEEDSELAYTYSITVPTAISLFSDELPYNLLSPVQAKLAMYMQRDDLSVEQQQTLFRAAKSFVLSSSELGLGVNAEAERVELMFGPKSLAKRISDAKKTWAKNDYFLQRLATKIDPLGKDPDLVEYDAAKTGLEDDVENITSWFALLMSTNAEQKQIGVDLLKYAFFTSGQQNARNFVKFIPWAAIEGTGIAKGLREFNLKDNWQSNQFLKQFLQHNPKFAREIPGSMREIIGSPKDSFTIPPPPINEDGYGPFAGIMAGKNYIPFLAYKDNNYKWVLFEAQPALENGQIPYVRIDLLGDKTSGVQEYTHGVEDVGSLFPANRWKEDSGIVAVQNLTPLQQIGINKKELTYDEVLNTLMIIEADEDMPSYMRTLANFLSKTPRNSVEQFVHEKMLGNPLFKLKLDQLDKNVAGTFKAPANILILDGSKYFNKRDAAMTLLHELVHYHTVFLAESYEPRADRTGDTREVLNEVREFVKQNKEMNQKLEEMYKVYEQAKQAYTTYGRKNEDIDYSLSSFAEFVARALTDKKTMAFLNSVEYRGERNLINRLKDLISQLWKSISDILKVPVDESSLLAQAIRTSVEIMSYQTKANDNWNKNGLPPFNEGLDYNNIAPQTDAIARVIAALEEQKSNMIMGQLQLKDPKAKARRMKEIKDIEMQIAELKQSKQLPMIAEVGNVHMKWIEKVTKKENPQMNEINVAIKLANMWEGVHDLMYGENADVDSPELDAIKLKAGKLLNQLLKPGSETYRRILDLERKDMDNVEIEDLGSDEVWIRSMRSASRSPFFSKTAAFVETMARQEQEEVLRTLKGLEKLEQDMIAYAGGKKQLQALYNKLMQPGDKHWGLIQQYSGEWYSWLNEQQRKRNGRIYRIENDDKMTAVEKDLAKRKAWDRYWNEMQDNAIFFDTTRFLDPDNGMFVADFDQKKTELVAQLGEEAAEKLITEGQAKYLAYLERRDAFFDTVDESVALGEMTQEEAEQEKTAFKIAHSPNAFFSAAALRTSSTEAYVAFAPKQSKDKFWNKEYKEVMNDKELASLYKRYETLLKELTSYLPTSVQNKLGDGFLPIVRKAVMSSMADYKGFLEGFGERTIKRLAASPTQEKLDENNFERIPVEFVKASEAALDERSRDLIGIARVFSMMAIHYKHASAAKDVVDMGQLIISEMDKARRAGTVQVRRDGKLEPVRKGFDNAMKAFEYLNDYIIYRKPKALEANLGAKLYSEKEIATTQTGERKVIGESFNLSPLKQRQISQRVKTLLADRTALENRYTNPKEGEELSYEDYIKQVQKIDEELERYEGHAIYGSKVGDVLIGINQLKALSYNPFSGFQNLTFGMLSAGIHASGGRDFSWANLKTATGLMLKARTDKKLAEKIINVMDRLGVIGDYVDTKYGKAPEFRDKKNFAQKYLDPFVLMRETDFFMKGSTSLAVMLHEQVQVEDGKVSVWETFAQDGNWDEEKYGKREDWYSDDVTKQKSWDKFRNKVIAVNMVIHGNQDKFSPKLANKYILGRLLGQFRMSWLPEGFYNRFQSERYDAYLDRTVKGRYRTVGGIGIGGSMLVMGKQLLNLLPGVQMDVWADAIVRSKGKDGKDTAIYLRDSDLDQENMRRNFAEMLFFMSISAAVLSLKYLVLPDDEENKGKKAAIQLLINLLIRSRQDIQLYASPGVFDTVFRNPIPATDVLKDWYKMTTATGRFIIDDEYEFEQWILKVTKAFPYTNLINKTKYMIEKDLDDAQ
jgi:hypothetical protein